MKVSPRCWSSLVLLGAISCGGASHSPGQNSAGAAGISNGSSGDGGSNGGSTAGKPGSGGSSTAGGSAATGTGGMVDGSGAGTHSGVGGAGAPGVPGACFGREIDIPSVVVSGTIKILDTAAGNYGTVTLGNGTDSVPLGTTETESYSLHVVPGTYDVLFTGKSNGVHTLKAGVIVAPSGTTVIDVGIPNAIINAPRTSMDPNAEQGTLAGKFTVDGQTPPSPNGSGVRLFARLLGSNTWWAFATVMLDHYSGMLAPGTYDIGFDPASGALVPGWLPSDGNNIGIVATGVVVSRPPPNEYNIEVQTAPVSGVVTFSGAALPTGCTWYLRSPNVASAAFALDAAGAYSGRVPPGTYDLIYRGAGKDSACPMNTLATLKRGIVVPVAGATVPPVDVLSVQLAGQLKLNGAALSDPVDDGTLSLRTADGDSIVLGKLSAGNFAVHVIPGSYDVYFDLGNSAVAMQAPINLHGKLSSVTLMPGGPATLDIDVRSTLISGTVKIGGGFVDKEYDGGRLWLGDPKTPSTSTPLTWTSTGKYSAQVIPGTYDLYYQGTAPSTLAPFNTSAKLGCVEVP